MKHLLSFSAILFAVICIFTSCKKNYTCNCDIRTYAIKEADTVKRTSTSIVIKATKDDARAQCEDYELDTEHLGRPAIEYHYCNIESDED